MATSSMFYLLIIVLNGPSSSMETIPMDIMETCEKEAAETKRQFDSMPKHPTTTMMVRCVSTL